MKQIAIITITALLFFSCSQKVMPIKGTYAQPPIEISTTKSFDEVWDRLVDLFAQNGLSIRIIDRSSGLIISGSTSLSATTEKKEGGLQEPSAFIVVPKVYSSIAQRYVPITKYLAGPYVSKDYIDKVDPVSGDWNVRIKKTATGSIVNVNLVNLTYTVIQDKITRQVPLTQYKSTGVFEKFITDLILK